MHACLPPANWRASNHPLVKGDNKQQGRRRTLVSQRRHSLSSRCRNISESTHTPTPRSANAASHDSCRSPSSCIITFHVASRVLCSNDMAACPAVNDKIPCAYPTTPQRTEGQIAQSAASESSLSTHVVQ